MTLGTERDYSKKTMALITGQQLSRYFDQFNTIDVTFSKGVVEALGLKTDQNFLKCLGNQWPCIIYSASMKGARVVANLTQDFFNKIREANNIVSLRFAFNQPDKADPLAFFIPAKVTGYNPYNKEKPDLMFITLEYTQRPADDLIAILGQLLETNVNSKKRREERIDVTDEVQRSLGLRTKSIFLYIEGIPRKSLLRDISFSGAKCITSGIAKFLENKNVSVSLEFDDKKTPMQIPGKIIRYENVQGRKDIVALAILFEESKVPMDYKMRINEYLRIPKKHLAKDPGE